MLVDGAGSTWTNSGNVRIGGEGTGNLTIRNGATVSNDRGIITPDFGGAGSVIVSGAGSTWTNTSNINLGGAGPASLKVEEGATVSSANGLINGISGTTTTALVDGAGSTWSNLLLSVNSGLLEITNGGAVSARLGWIASDSGGNGAVLVDGTGSTWTVSEQHFVGRSGTGRLTIQNGGVVSMTGMRSTYIGESVGGNGAVLVRGVGSTWTNSGALLVGFQGTGELTIQDGGTVSSIGGNIGADGGSHGTVLVDGNGSTWNSSQNLGIGSLGTGRLTIQNGGRVNVKGGTGAVELTAIPPGIGTLDIGAFGGGTTAGTLNAAIVTGGMGTAVVNFNQTDTITFAPQITGSISVNQLGSGTTILTGANTYTGATNVVVGTLHIITPGDWTTSAATIQNGGTLRVNNGADTIFLADQNGGPGTLNIGAFGGGTTAGTLNAANVTDGSGTGVVNFNQTDTITFAPQITGSISVNQLGSGTTIFSGFNWNDYTGPTNIRNGTLVVDSRIWSNTFVHPGGTLSGRGAIFGNVSNSGIVSPSTEFPTMSIFGNYTQQNDGTLRIVVAGTQPGQYSLLTVLGNAYLSGTLEIVREGQAMLKVGDRLGILVAGVLTGTFSTIINPFASGTMLGVQVIYTEQEVLLAFTQSSYLQFALSAGLTQNQIAVARAIDQVVSDPRAAQAMAFLNAQPLSDVPGDLSRLAPEELTSIFNLATSLANIQSMNIQRRMQDIRDTAAASPETSGGLSAIAEGPNDWRWGMWFTGSGEFTRVGSTANASGFDFESGGLTAGVDYRFTDHFAAGISIGFMNTTAGLADGGKVDVNGGTVGAYATWFDRGLYLDAAVSAGPNSYTTRRTTPNNTTASGSPDGAEVNLLFATGYDRTYKGLTFGPFARIQFTSVDINAFTERGTFAPLSVASENAQSLRSALGFHASFDGKVGRAIIRPEVRAAWQHEFADTSYSLTSSFATLGGSAFTVTGPATGRDSLLVTAGFNILWNERFSTYAFYDGELLRRNFISNNISVGCRYRF